MNSRVANKIALVTGAGRGIGRAIAMALAREGATVYATDILAAEIEETAELIRGAGGIVTAIVHDVLEPDAWSQVVAQVRAASEHLDILVNNAGRRELGSIEKSSLAAWREIIAINLDSGLIVDGGNLAR